MIRARLRNWYVALQAMVGLLRDSRHRPLFREMRAFARRLPDTMSGPLPRARDTLTPTKQDISLDGLSERDLRNLADLAALLEWRSPLGLCLRRSLTRYHFLRRAGIPVEVQFGARLAGRSDRRIAGHAWVTLDGQPYHEAGENWRGFTVMITWPGAV